jgi:hypothetical protein
MAAVTIGASGPVGLRFDVDSQKRAGDAKVVDTHIVPATSARAAIRRNFTAALGIAAGTLGSIKAAAHRTPIRPATFYQSSPRATNFGKNFGLFI